MNKLVTPPHTSHATSAESDSVSGNYDDASAVLDEGSSLNSFLESQIAKVTEIENAKNSNEHIVAPANSPETRNYGRSYPEDAYVGINDDFIRASMDIDTSDPEIRKELLEKHATNYKTAHDPEFATSPISIKEEDYDFSVDLSLISIVENEPFVEKKMIML